MEYTIFWLVALVLFIVIELGTMGLTTIWFAAGALAAVLVSATGLSIWVQIIVCLAVSLLLLIFTRPFAVRYFNKDRTKTNVESLIGKQAVVTGEIDNRQGIGQVVVGGQEWSACTLEDGVRIPEGSIMDIVEIRGVKLIVALHEEKSASSLT